MGRGRKPKERKGYFYEKEESAVVEYINSDDIIRKNELFDNILYPAFSKMVESIIRRYKLYVPDEEFEQTFNDTISYLMTKISHYKPIIYEYEEITEIPEKAKAVMINEEQRKELFKNITKDSPEYIIVDYDSFFKTFQLIVKRYKAFSYCQTIVRNYLMFKGIQYVKEQQRNTPYDVISDNFSNNVKYSTDGVESYVLAEKLIKKTSDEIKKMLEMPEQFNLNENEITVGTALINLLNNWEMLTLDTDSNKLQKNKVLYVLREETLMSTKCVRDNMKKFKNIYYLLKKKEIE